MHMLKTILRAIGKTLARVVARFLWLATMP